MPFRQQMQYVDVDLGSAGQFPPCWPGIGIYGLMAYSVQQRTQEIGIRMALGAGVSHLRGMVVRQGMTFALIGVAVGLSAAFGLARLISRLSCSA